jgi:hypothetical protein
MVDSCDESFTVYHQPRHTKARKAHKCDECRREIEPHEYYYRADGLFEGSWNIYRICAHCYVACEWLKANCDGFLHCGVFEDISEHITEYRGQAKCIPRLARLKFGMESRWRFRRGPHKGQLTPLPILPGLLEPPASTVDAST